MAEWSVPIKVEPPPSEVEIAEQLMKSARLKLVEAQELYEQRLIEYQDAVRRERHNY